MQRITHKVNEASCMYNIMHRYIAIASVASRHRGFSLVPRVCMHAVCKLSRLVMCACMVQRIDSRLLISSAAMRTHYMHTVCSFFFFFFFCALKLVFSLLLYTLLHYEMNLLHITRRLVYCVQNNF